MNNIVLAGGKGERLYNKLLMCTHTACPVICSSIDQYVSHAIVPKIFVNENQIELFRRILSELFSPDRYELAVDNYQGISGIISSLLAEDHLTVLCGDNIYPTGILEQIKLGEAACIQSSDNQLDGFADGLWRDRNYLGNRECLRLITPWKFYKMDAVDTSFTLIELLNYQKIKPVLLGGEGWFDIGTPEKLEAFYDYVCKQAGE